MTSEELSAALRNAWELPFSVDFDHRHLLKLAADELDRLRKVIDDYAAICQGTAREIRALREAAGLPVDGRAEPEAATDSPDWQRPAYRTLGPSTWTSE